MQHASTWLLLGSLALAPLTRAASPMPPEERMADVEARQAALEKPDRSATKNPSNLTSGFSFKGYARSGRLVDEGLGGGRGGPYVTPADALGGAGGRLGNEDDPHMRIDLSKALHAETGTRSKFTVSIADGVESSNERTAAESSLNVRLAQDINSNLGLRDELANHGPRPRGLPAAQRGRRRLLEADRGAVAVQYGVRASGLWQFGGQMETWF